MSTALATNGNATEGMKLAQFGELSVQGVVDRKRKIGEIMKSVMREGDHYGKIPGCGDKPALFKAGAEILAMTFALAPKFKITKTELANGHREIEIICTLVHIPTGLEVGEGVGSCSTMESKYRWRQGARKCPECGKANTIIKGKADYGGGWLCFAKKGGCGQKWPDGTADIESQSVDRAENPDIYDQMNTVLKMAKKRAQVDATLTATGASDLLTQDIEDLPPGSVANHDAIDAEYTETRTPRVVADEGIIDEVRATKTRDALRALAPRLNAIPKGTPLRTKAKAACADQEALFDAAEKVTA